MGRGNFEGGKGQPIVKYTDTAVICAKMVEPVGLPCGCGLGWIEGSTSSIVFTRWQWHSCALIGGHIGATSMATMWLYIKLLLELVAH